jgi:2-polyprenyl-6-methoxyphenol hydroxylase-like FAD-dependent oxidoreductase
MRIPNSQQQDDMVETLLQSKARWMNTISLHQGILSQHMQRPEPSLVIEHATLIEEMVNIVKETALSTEDCGNTPTTTVTFCWDTCVESILWQNQTLVLTSSSSTKDSSSSSMHNTNHENNGNTNSYQMPFDVLVGADGMNSVVRQSLWQWNRAKETETTTTNDDENSDKDSFTCHVSSVPGGFLPFRLSRHPHHHHHHHHSVSQTEETSTHNNQKKQPQALETNAIHGWMSGHQNILAAFLPTQQEDVGTAVFSYTTPENPLEQAETVQDFYDILGKDLACYVETQEALGLLERQPTHFVTAECSRLTQPSLHTVLLGDAAHTFSATINQGANAALEDAHVLQQCLKDCSYDWSKALHRYEAIRGPEIQAAQVLSKYSLPVHSKRLQTELIGRMILRKLLPSSWGVTQKLLPPLPMELLPHPGLSYTDILKQTSWWTDKVQASLQKEQGKVSSTMQADVRNTTGTLDTSASIKHRISRFA